MGIWKNLLEKSDFHRLDGFWYQSRGLVVYCKLYTV